MIKVSIIIPVYNVELYLRKALDSCINQTMKEIEIICVDDCSTDSSFEILKEYAQKDERFVLIQQDKNCGQGIARNIAVKKANGKYIMFLDPDDWFETDACEVMYNAAEKNNAKIVQSAHIEHMPDGTSKIEDCFYNYSKKNKIEILPNTFVDTMKLPNTTFRSFRNCPWGKIYLLEHIINKNIQFAHYRKGEDHKWTIDAKLSTPFFYIDKPTYNYLIRNNSAVCTYKTLYEEPIENLKEVLNKYPKDKNIIDKFNKYVTWRYSIKFRKSGKILPYFYIKNRHFMNFQQRILFLAQNVPQELFSVKNKAGRRYINQKSKVIKILGLKFEFKISD